jgi:glycosyltransferase involved in cell wall biosynthesis
MLLQMDMTRMISEKLLLKKNKQFTIVYTGTMSSIYPMETFIEAVLLLQTIDLKIQIVGNVHHSFIDKITELNIQNMFEFTGRLSHQEALNYMFSADLLLLLIPRTKNSKEILTGKLFEYIASGKPILCVGPTDGDAAEIIKKSERGRTSGFKSVEDLSENIKFYFNKRSLNETKTDSDKLIKYSRKSLTKNLASFLNQKIIIN